MPHTVSKGIGLQALVLCGPGSSFPTFTANPDENPKALLPIANRPMVWYPLDFCSRAGITDVTLICPLSAAEAIKTALKTNPFLTSLPTPTVLAPRELDQTTGTAALLRLPQVRELVEADFVILPCDLVCELGGEKLLQAWMVRAASLVDVLGDDDGLGSSVGGGQRDGGGASARQGAHSGGLGVWYNTTSGLPAVKGGEETDFVATVPLPPSSSSSSPSLAYFAPHVVPSKTTAHSVLPYLERVVTAMPTDSLNDLLEEQDGYPVRHGLLRRHRRLRMRTTHRDAHIYVFPQWVMDFVAANKHMDSIGEDVVGWWAKATWQPGLPQKLSLDKVLQAYSSSAEATAGSQGDAGNTSSHGSNDGEGDDAAPESSTSKEMLAKTAKDGRRASATAAPSSPVAETHLSTTSTASATKTSTALATSTSAQSDPVKAPPMLAYVHPSAPPTGVTTVPLIRRVDTSQLLLTVSLQLAKLPSLEDVAVSAAAVGSSAPSISASPFSHARKVAYPEGVKSRTTITRQDCLVADNVTVEEKVSIKESVVGANCQIQEGAKLLQCLLMEGVVVGKGCRLTRCILGRRSEIGAGSILTDCEVQENLLVEPKTEEKDNNFMSSEGLEATAEEMDEAMQEMDDDDNGSDDEEN